MNTKEAIEFLDHMANSFKCISSLNCKSIDKKKNEIVAILEQGEAYRQIVEDLKYSMCRLADYDVEQDWLSELYKLEQKYFPKEAKQ